MICGDNIPKIAIPAPVAANKILPFTAAVPAPIMPPNKQIPRVKLPVAAFEKNVNNGKNAVSAAAAIAGFANAPQTIKTNAEATRC